METPVRFLGCHRLVIDGTSLKALGVAEMYIKRQV
jgi:hypothetical protein